MTARFLACAAAVAMTAWSYAALTLDVNFKNGDSLKGDVQFVVNARSENLITSVEFYVGDDLRGNDSSRPYTFDLDTLTEADGPFKVKFAAYTREGDQAQVTLNLKIDNGMALGVDHHVKASQEATSEGKWDEAIYHGRVAIKIDPESNPARMALSRANLGKGILDLAQKYAEDVVAAEPTNIDARTLLSGISLRRAFNAFQSGAGDRAATVRLISDALVSAASNQRKAVDQRLDAFGEVNDANLIAWADTMIDARRFGAVISRLSPLFNADNRRTDVGNRLVYAQLRSGRYTDARRNIELMRRFGSPDGYTFAVSGILSSIQGNRAAADEDFKQALLSDPTGLAVQSANIYANLIQGNVRGFSDLTTQLRTATGPNPISDYYLMIALAFGRDFEASRATFESAILFDPLSAELLTERAYQVFGFSYTASLSSDEANFQRQYAKGLLRAAIEARPESFEALSALSALELQLGNNDEALRWARAAVAAGPDYAGAHFALSGALSALNRPTDARNAATKAGELDRRLSGATTPRAQDLFRYLAVSGRSPWLFSPKATLEEF